MTRQFFRWVPGRQSLTGVNPCPYEKFCIMNFRIGRFGFDFYILRFNHMNSMLAIHVDPLVPEGKHYRLNIRLLGKCEFKLAGVPHYMWRNTILFFRPDIVPHGLFIFNRTIILSAGAAYFNGDKNSEKV